MRNPKRQKCTWLFGRGASIASGLDWRVPPEWKNSLKQGKDTRDEHIAKIKKALKAEMNDPKVHSRPYRGLLEIMHRNREFCYHLVTTTNWDFLLQKEINWWYENKSGKVVPEFLADGNVWHFNGTVQPDLKNQGPFLLETDGARFRKATFVERQAYSKLYWSNLIVIVGVSFEARVDKGLLGALKSVEDDLPIGKATFLVVDSCKQTNDRTFSNLVHCFPRAEGIQIYQGFEEWVNGGMPELVKGGIFK